MKSSRNKSLKHFSFNNYLYLTVNKLASQNIQVVRNCKGDVHQIVKDYLAGNIQDGGSNCASHAHEEGHVCSHN